MFNTDWLISHTFLISPVQASLWLTASPHVMSEQLNHTFPLINSFNITEAGFFLRVLCFRRAFISLMYPLQRQLSLRVGLDTLSLGLRVRWSTDWIVSAKQSLKIWTVIVTFKIVGCVKHRRQTRQNVYQQINNKVYPVRCSTLCCLFS